ncbi:MAG: helix-turn-helix domain-containing protein [Arcicella sp.]|nr:helix-turn-helix domain-containing protein [Arcicella sp.]
MSKSIINTREKKNLKQSEVAARMGIDQPNYSRLEKRGKKLTLEQIEAIAKALEVSPNVLIGIEGEGTSVKDDVESLTRQNEEYKKRIEELEARLLSLDEANRIKEELNNIKQAQLSERTKLIQEKVTEKMLETMYEIAQKNDYTRLVKREKFEADFNKIGVEEEDDYNNTGKYFYYVSRSNDVAVVTKENFEKLLSKYYKDPWVKAMLEFGLATEKEQAEWEDWKLKNPNPPASPLDSYLETFSEVGAMVASMVRNPFQTIGSFSNLVTYKFE